MDNACTPSSMQLGQNFLEAFLALSQMVRGKDIFDKPVWNDATICVCAAHAVGSLLEGSFAWLE